MGKSASIKTACLAIAGIATAWAAAPTPALAATPENVAETSTATVNSGTITNPQFLYVSNSSDPGPISSNVALPAANFANGTNATAAFNFQGDNDALPPPDPPFPGSMNYMLVGLAPNGDLVAGVSAAAATNFTSTNASFDSVFGAGNEAILLNALENPGSSSDAALDNFALTFAAPVTANPNVNSYTFFNFPDSDPGTGTLSLIDFADDPSDTQVGSVGFTFTSSDVPEPASLALLAAPMLALFARRKRA